MTRGEIHQVSSFLVLDYSVCSAKGKNARLVNVGPKCQANGNPRELNTGLVRYLDPLCT